MAEVQKASSQYLDKSWQLYLMGIVCCDPKSIPVRLPATVSLMELSQGVTKRFHVDCKMAPAPIPAMRPVSEVSSKLGNGKIFIATLAGERTLFAEWTSNM